MARPTRKPSCPCRAPLLCLASLVGLLPACAGGLHRRGDHQVTLLGSFDHPIKGETIWHDGDGRADNAGLALGYDYFVTDRFSAGLALTPYRIYNQSDGDVYAGEFQIALRYYLAEWQLGPAPVGLFAEVLGGLMQSAKSVPEAGSHTNFTQDTGLGVEVQLTDQLRWLTGYRFRHLSNGGAFGDDNPAQNDHQAYTGLSFTWK